jgi:hypothetical protein
MTNEEVKTLANLNQTGYSVGWEHTTTDLKEMSLPVASIFESPVPLSTKGLFYMRQDIWYLVGLPFVDAYKYRNWLYDQLSEFESTCLTRQTCKLTMSPNWPMSDNNFNFLFPQSCMTTIGTRFWNP